MDVKAVIFDIGETLIYYNNYLNWQALYSPALKNVMAACDFACDEQADKRAQNILTKYNTRINPREYEVNSNDIFTEILNDWQIDINKLQAAKQAFYDYFQNGASLYDDTESTLRSLADMDIKIGALSDVAYGMDNEYALKDLTPIMKYFDICLTSTDVGYRKPNKKGYELCLKYLGVPNNQAIYVGNEEKDITGANNAGMVSVLINRESDKKKFSQNFTIRSLSEILSLIK